MKTYKNAFIVMKANPPTNGHLYLINTASEYCEKVTVLVGSLPNDDIPGEYRFKWLREIYDGTNVDIKWCDEILPQYPEEHKDFWNIWIDVAKRYCPPDIDVIFSSELYGEIYAKYLGISSYVVDLERKVYPISATMVRNNPILYWEYIPNNIKPYFVKRIAIMGPESTGKSMLSTKLAEYFNTEYVEEYGRTVYEENGNFVNIDDFIKISIGRQKIEDNKIKTSNKFLFCDTEDITTYYFSKEFYPNEYKKVENFLLEEIEKKPKYDIYILLKTDCDIIQDGTRSFLDKRDQHYQIIKNLLLEKKCKFVEIGGSWDNRFLKSIDIINNTFYKNEKI